MEEKSEKQTLLRKSYLYYKAVCPQWLCFPDYLGSIWFFLSPWVVSNVITCNFLHITLCICRETHIFPKYIHLMWLIMAILGLIASFFVVENYWQFSPFFSKLSKREFRLEKVSTFDITVWSWLHHLLSLIVSWVMIFQLW